MSKFFTAAAFLLLLIILLLLATNNVGNPAVLSTVEYSINSDAALADRDAEREHNERMAEIAAARAESESYYRTLRLFGLAAIVAVSLFGVALVFGVTRRPKVLLLDDRARAPSVIDPEHKRLEVKR